MTRLTLTLALAALASVCHAQDPALNAREQAFADAVCSVMGQPLEDYEREANADGTVLALYFANGETVTAAHYTNDAMAHEAAAGSALYSGMADDARLIELRGTCLLSATAPFATGDLAKRLREEGWNAFPHDAPSKPELFMLNLHDDGLVVRVNKAVTDAYYHLKSSLEDAMQEATDYPDEGYTILGPGELTQRDGERFSHVKVTDASGAQVIALTKPTAVLRAAAKWIGLPLPEQPSKVGLIGAFGPQ